MKKKARSSRPSRIVNIFGGALQCGVAIVALVPALAHAQQAPAPKRDFSLKILSYNIWNLGQNSPMWDPAAKQQGQLVFRSAMDDLIAKSNPDVVVLPELNNNIRSWNGILISQAIIDGVVADLNKNAGAPLAQTNAGTGPTAGSNGDVFSILPFQDVGDNTVKLSPTNGFPVSYFSSIHYCYYDGATDSCGGAGGSRQAEAQASNAIAASRDLPTILSGDFNAGDVSERGLERASQQKLVLKGAAGGNTFYQTLAREYAQNAENAGKQGVVDFVNQYIANGKSSAAIPDGLFVDEAYPVMDNIPITANILKQQFEMIQTPGDREPFAPHASANDGSNSWTSLGHDDTNTWASWDHVKIDHILVSRPFAKWVEADSTDPYHGVLHQLGDFDDNGKVNSLSDHEPYAQKLVWVGPLLESYGSSDENTRLVWGEGAPDFDARNKEFVLTRNNMRNDLYIGQLADADGNPYYGSPSRAFPAATQLTPGQLSAIFAQAVYETGSAPFRAQLVKYVSQDQLAVYNNYLTTLSNGNYRPIIQNYFNAHRAEFPGINSISSMSWQQWGDILLKYASDLTLNTVDQSVDPSVANALKIKQIEAALHLDDPQIRQQMAQRLGLDFDNDPNAVLKIPLDCGNKDMLSLQGATAACIDDHSFIGETLVTDKGTLIVDEDAALGGPDARLRLADGGLRTQGASMTALDRAISLEGPGGSIDIVDAAATVTAKKQISGTGTLTKLGDGTLQLGAVNAYTGGTVVEKGTLKAGIAGAFVNATPYMVNGGKLDLNGFDLTMSWLSSTGGSVDLGTAKLTLDQAEGSIYSGSLSGSGSFRKAGAGTLSLLGDSSGFTGATTVLGGVLRLGSGSQLGGSLDVLSGATLAGSGRVGSTTIESGGFLSPGNSIGTLTVAGDLTFAAGSTYLVQIAGNGDADKVMAVAGKADVAGAHVQVDTLDPESSYQEGKRYTILGADSVEGKFADAVTQSAFLDLALEYSAKAVDLVIGLKSNSFGKVAETDNQRSVADALGTLEQSGASLALYNKLLMLNASDARAAFDQLSGEVQASVKTALIQQSHLINDAVDDRLRSAFGDVAAQSLPIMAYGPDGVIADTATTPNGVAWSQIFGSWSSIDGAGLGSLDYSNGGLVTGVDGTIGDWRVGVMAGYSRSKFDIEARSSSGNNDNYHIGLYGGSQMGALSLRTGLAYSWHRISTQRSVDFPGFSGLANADYDAGSLQAFGELGYRLDAGTASFEPFLNLSHVRMHTDGFTEKGGSVALDSAATTTDTTSATIGLRASTDLDIGQAKTTLGGMLAWRHAFGDTTPAASMSFEGSDAFTVAGLPIAKDTALIQAGLNFRLSEAASLGVNYNGQFGSGAATNGADAKLTLKF